MFVHLVRDEKFIDDARELFETVAPGRHRYLLISDESPLRFVRRFEPERLSLDQALRPGFLRTLDRCDAIIVHYLDMHARLVVAAAPAQTRIVWLGWGADYYHLIAEARDLLEPRTRDLLAQIERERARPPWTQRVLSLIRSGLSGLADPLAAMRRWARRRRRRLIGPRGAEESALLARVSIFAPVLEEDYRAVKAAHPDFGARFACWNYPTAGVATGSDPSLQVTGNDILLGNSATAENNHLDALPLLASLKGDRRVICPLSYGSDAYAEKVARAGQALLGAGFRPLRDFLPAAEYRSLLCGCSVVVMNHIRQQAMGNILLMLWLGARVFLHERSPVLPALRALGLPIHAIAELPAFLDAPPPDAAAVAEQRRCVEKRFGRTTLLELTAQLLALAAPPAPTTRMER